MVMTTIPLAEAKAVRDGVVAGAQDRRAGLDQPVASFAQLIVAVADFQPEVVHPEPPPGRQRGGVLADLDQQQLMMGCGRPAR
jgi:hypothetical protein